MGAVITTKTMIATARATTATSPKCSATASMIRITPKAEALVVACMRVNRSGMRSRPSDANNIRDAPVSISVPLANSIIARPSTLQKTGEADGSQKTHQRNDDGGIDKNRYVGLNGVETHQSHHDAGKQLQGHHPIRQARTAHYPHKGQHQGQTHQHLADQYHNGHITPHTILTHSAEQLQSATLHLLETAS